MKPGAATEPSPEKLAKSPIQTDTLSRPAIAGTGSVMAEFWVGASQGVVQLMIPSQPGAAPPVLPVGETNVKVRQPDILDVFPVTVFRMNPSLVVEI